MYAIRSYYGHADVVFKEAARVLQPGGQVAFSTLCPDTFAELRAAFADVDQHRHTLPFNQPDSLQAALDRITSYNVCYTKLLRTRGCDRQFLDVGGLAAIECRACCSDHGWREVDTGDLCYWPTCAQQTGSIAGAAARVENVSWCFSRPGECFLQSFADAALYHGGAVIGGCRAVEGVADALLKRTERHGENRRCDGRT